MTNGAANQTSSDQPTLHGVLVHSASAPGKLIRVDGVAARAAGATVITGQHLLDLDPYIGPVVRDQPLLAIDRVRYTGEPVALVLADDLDAARFAAALVTSEVGLLAPGATGAANGQPPLVHLIEMLRPGPSPIEGLIAPNRSNELMSLVASIDPVFREETDPWEGVTSFVLPAGESGRLLTAQATIAGSDVTLASCSFGHQSAQLAQLFDPIGLTISRTPGRGASTLAPAIDALAIAAARSTRRPVHLVAATDDFGWSGPRGRLAVTGADVTLTIDAGASVGSLPLRIDSISEMLTNRFLTGSLIITITYSESPPIAATLDDWREALSRV